MISNIRFIGLGPLFKIFYELICLLCQSIIWLVFHLLLIYFLFLQLFQSFLVALLKNIEDFFLVCDLCIVVKILVVVLKLLAFHFKNLVILRKLAVLLINFLFDFSDWVSEARYDVLLDVRKLIVNLRVFNFMHHSITILENRIHWWYSFFQNFLGFLTCCLFSQIGFFMTLIFDFR